MNPTVKTGLGLIIGSIILVGIGLFTIDKAFSDLDDTAAASAEDGRDGCGSDIGSRDIFTYLYDEIFGCDKGDWGLGACCLGIALILVAIGIGFSGVTTILTGAVFGGKKVRLAQLEEEVRILKSRPDTSTGVVIGKQKPKVKTLDEEIEELEL